MSKRKKCKGTTTATKGFGCNNELPIASTRNNINTYKHKFGLGLDCGCLSKWLDTPEGKEYMQSQLIPRAIKETQKQARQKHRAEKLKITDFSSKLQSALQETARIIDYGQPCLARQNIPAQFHGGHIITKGSNKQLSYNLHNIHRQGGTSNHTQKEDPLMWEGLRREYGLEYHDFVLGLKKLQTLKPTQHELKEAYEAVTKLNKKLRNRKNIYNTQERIEARNDINLLLGLYPEEYAIFKTPYYP